MKILNKQWVAWHDFRIGVEDHITTNFKGIGIKL